MGEPRLRMDRDAYLAFERTSSVKHELWDGEVYIASLSRFAVPSREADAMEGASLAHNWLVANILQHLNTALEQRDCKALPSDMRVRVADGDRYVYPDVSVVSGRPQLEGDGVELSG